MDFHEVTGLFPLMTGEEYEALKADIAGNGQREPIWTHQGKIIDGRNRWRACHELGIEPKLQEWDGNGSLVAFVVSLNLHRRHLSASQKAVVAAEMMPMLELEAKEKQKRSGEKGGLAPPKRYSKKVQAILPEPSRNHVGGVGLQARDEAASIVGAGSRYIQDAKEIKQKAPDLFDQVRAGKLNIPQAKRELKRRVKKAELEKKAKEATKQRARQTWEVLLGDCLDLLPKVKQRVRLVFADPPYNIGIDYGQGAKADLLPAEQYLAWCRRWVDACVNLLTNDGAMWVMICDEWADRFGVMLTEAGLHRRAWIKWYETFGVNCSNNFNRCSRHLFYCVLDPKRFVFNANAVTRPSDRQTKYGDKRADPGGKIWDDVWQIPRLVDNSPERMPGFPTQVPLAITRAIVGACSDPGDLVLDPFNGSGSTGVAAIELGRRYLGIEKEMKFWELAKMRLATTQSESVAD